MSPRPVVLLGPQRHVQTLRAAVDSLGIGPGAKIAAVTAGWEEREDEDGELAAHLGGRTVNLAVYRRADDVYRRDPELHRALLDRHARLLEHQDLYRLRLRHAVEAARDLLERTGDPRVLGPEREDAFEAVRALDAQHLARVADVHREFEERWRPRERASVARHRREIAALFEGAAALCVAGGHVGILLNRMALLDVLPLWRDGPIVAWSAGAMLLSERIVLFHDSPPQGPGAAEVLAAGLGAHRGLVALPHPRHRLRLDDPARVALLARRFQPALCAALDDGARFDWDGARWRAAPGSHRLAADGAVVEAAA